MKVCTDACLFGAWIAGKITLPNLPVNNILDIGCGTGLLSLMIAQKITATTDAIEIDESASTQAAENVATSPWHKNINVKNITMQQFVANKQFDLIICNPPFFEDDLKSSDEDKNAAKHDTTLKFVELIPFIKNNLVENGHAAVLIPYQRTNYFATIAKQHQLFIAETLFVKQSPSHPYFRSILWLTRKETRHVEVNELIIHDEQRNYTDGFTALLKDYYLKL